MIKLRQFIVTKNYNSKLYFDFQLTFLTQGANNTFHHTTQSFKDFKIK
jgi:hypothetical protein